MSTPMGGGCAAVHTGIGSFQWERDARLRVRGGLGCGRRTQPSAAVTDTQTQASPIAYPRASTGPPESLATTGPRHAAHIPINGRIRTPRARTCRRRMTAAANETASDPPHTHTTIPPIDPAIARDSVRCCAPDDHRTRHPTKKAANRIHTVPNARANPATSLQDPSRIRNAPVTTRPSYLSSCPIQTLTGTPKSTRPPTFSPTLVGTFGGSCCRMNRPDPVPSAESGRPSNVDRLQLCG